jgi:hypothetical protein
VRRTDEPSTVRKLEPELPAFIVGLRDSLMENTEDRPSTKRIYLNVDVMGAAVGVGEVEFRHVDVSVFLARRTEFKNESE